MRNFRKVLLFLFISFFFGWEMKNLTRPLDVGKRTDEKKVGWSGVVRECPMSTESCESQTKIYEKKKLEMQVDL